MTLWRSLLFLLTVCSLLWSCSRTTDTSTNGTTDPPVVPPSDTTGSGWKRITSAALPGEFDDVFFTDNATGYICGVQFISKSTDGGLSWSKLSVPAGEEKTNFFNLFFTDSDHGWVVCSNDSSYILKTADGGKSWRKIHEKSFPPDLTDIQFLNLRLGYLAGGNGLWKSIDSGNTWTKTPLPYTNNFGLFFIDSSKGWIGSKSTLESTQDGAQTFEIQKTMVEPTAVGVVKFTDATHGWACGYGALWKTTDGGKHWDSVKKTMNNSYSNDIHFLDQNKGYVMEGTAIYKTTDAGITFNKIFDLPTGKLVEIHFTDEQHGWVVSRQSLYRYVP